MTPRHWVALPLLALAIGHGATPAIAAPSGAAPATAAPPNTTKIYSTLHTDPTQVYDDGWGPAILGPLWHLQGVPGTRGPQQHFAVPFKAKANLDVTQLIVPLSQDADKDIDTVRISISSDAAGLPGDPIYTWEGLAIQHTLNPDNVARSCCTYLTPTAAPGAIPLKDGKTYWVVIWTTDTSRFQGMWYFNSRGLTGNDAYITDGGWTRQTEVLLPAVGVYGLPRE